MWLTVCLNPITSYQFKMSQSWKLWNMLVFVLASHTCANYHHSHCKSFKMKLKTFLFTVLLFQLTSEATSLIRNCVCVCVCLCVCIGVLMLMCVCVCVCVCVCACVCVLMLMCVHWCHSSAYSLSYSVCVCLMFIFR